MKEQTIYYIVMGFLVLLFLWTRIKLALVQKRAARAKVAAYEAGLLKEREEARKELEGKTLEERVAIINGHLARLGK